VYQTAKGKSLVRHQKAQKDKLTPKRNDQRSLFALCVIRWNSLTEIEKLPYIAPAQNAQLTTYAYFIKQALSNPNIHLGLVGYWGFNEAKQGTVKDLSKNGNSATLGPNWPSDAPQYVDSINPKNGKELLFDGAENFVDAGSDSILKPTQAITVECLINFNTAISGARPLSDWHQNNNEDRWLFFMRDTNRIEFITKTMPTRRQVGIMFNLTCHKQYYFAGTWDGLTMSFYVNGVLIDTKDTDPSMTSNIYSVRIGKQAQTGSGHDGTIDEVRISNRSKSEAEIIETNNKLYQLR